MGDGSAGSLTSRDGSLEPTARRNRLLNALPDADRQALVSRMRRREIGRDDVFGSPGEPVRSVCFPTRGIISLVTLLSDGRSVETATVGPDGMSGVEAVLAPNAVASRRSQGQISGEGLTMDASAFRREAEQNPRLMAVVLAYTQVQLAKASQAVACNALHDVPERTAKWLLHSHDAVDGDSFDLTQEFLAMMLAVTRPSVSVAARALQSAGLIEYRRGGITVVDRNGLEQAACECYAVAQETYESLMGASVTA